ncbi:Spt4/RpoE2 zinc finger-domain-containing protein [Usnea florida]
MSSAFVPGSQQRYLRACMVCSIVQTHARFLRDGCPNCESFLGLANSTDAVQECTSQVFEGLITLADPTTSWVARWQRLEGCVSGVYAVKVVGTPLGLEGQPRAQAKAGSLKVKGKGRFRAKTDNVCLLQLPDDVKQNIEDAGARYIPRDGTADDDDTG